MRSAVESGNRWEEAISRNDLGCLLQSQGDLAGAEHQLELGPGDRAASSHRSTGSRSASCYSTRADMRLLEGRAADALADADRAIAQLTANGEPNPYVFGITVRAQVQALLGTRPDR